MASPKGSRKLKAPKRVMPESTSDGIILKTAPRKSLSSSLTHSAASSSAIASSQTGFVGRKRVAHLSDDAEPPFTSVQLKKLNMRLSSFSPISDSLHSLFLQAALRFFIFLLALTLSILLISDWNEVMKQTVGDHVAGSDRFDSLTKFVSFLYFMCKDVGRYYSALLFAVMIHLSSIIYCYLVAMLISLRASIYGLQNIESEVIKHRTGFLIRRFKDCSSRLDRSFAYSLTLVALSALNAFDFQSIPRVNIFLAILLPVLILLDECLMTKRIFEFWSVIYVIKSHVITLSLGISWIFSVRYFDPKIGGSVQNDLHQLLTVLLLLFPIHYLGEMIIFVIRSIKASSLHSEKRISLQEV